MCRPANRERAHVRDPSACRGCGQLSPSTPSLGQRPAPPVNLAKRNPAQRSAPPTLPTDKDHQCAGPESRASTRPDPSASPRLRPAVAIDPVAARCSSGAPPTGFAKKNSGDAASRARRKRKPTQADAVSDANSIHWRFFGSRGRPKVALRKAGAVSDADSMHSRPSPRRGCGHGRRPPLGPASGQRRRCIRKKIQRGARRPRAHAPTDKDTDVPARNARASKHSETHQLAAAAASRRQRPRSCSLLQRSAANRIRKKEQRRRRLAHCGKRKPMQADAVSDANSMHSRPSPRLRSATHPRPGKRPAPPVHHAKKIQRGARRPRTTRQRIKTPMCRLGIQSERTSKTH